MYFIVVFFVFFFFFCDSIGIRYWC